MNAYEIGRYLNLGASLIVLGLIAGFLIQIQGRNFLQHWVTRTAFTLWCVEWVMFIATYLLLGIYSGESYPAIVLLFLDIGSLAHLLFAVVFLSGDDSENRFFRDNKVWIGITASASALGCLTYYFGTNIPPKYELLYRFACIGPSELLANMAYIATGWAFVVRYRSGAAYLLLGLCIFYAVAQLPGYTEAFIFQPKAASLPNSSEWQEFFRSPALLFPFFFAPMKVIIASLCLCLFYTPFVQLPLSDEKRRAMIEKIAYQRYQDRGARPGHESEDWLQAEQRVYASAVEDKTPIWPTEPIEASSKWPNSTPIPLRKDVRTKLLWSLSVFLFLVGFIAGGISLKDVFVYIFK